MSTAFGQYPTTRLSAIVGAGSDEGEVRHRSWAAIARTYWKPAYKHARRKWQCSEDDAADLVQGFFLRAMEGDFFAGYDPARARFRTFFRVCLDRFAANAARDARREKRGGGRAALSLEGLALEWSAAERELEKTAPTAASPEELFDREWRRSLLGLAIQDLERDCAERGRGAVFAAFARYDLAEGERPTYEALGAELGVPATTITNHLGTARRQLRRFLHERLGELTASDAEREAEARLFFEAE